MSKPSLFLMAVAVCVFGLAQCPGEAADPLIQQVVGQLDAASYQGFLNRDLYTHAGDNRGFEYNSGAGQYEPTAQHDLARDNVLSHFNSLGLASSLDPFTFTAGKKTYAGANNVIGILAGVTNPTQYVVICGHYDSVQNPGADDNASGTAGVMEAARVMSQYTFETSIMFVAWDGEEKGLKGSWDWVNTNGVSSIVGAYNLDMLAYNGHDLDIADVYGTNAWTAGMTAAATEYVPNLTIRDLGSGRGWSDHWPFESNGVFAGGIIEDDDNPYYHTSDDNYDVAGYLDFDYAIDLLSVGVAAASDQAGVTLTGDFTGDGDVDNEDIGLAGGNFTGASGTGMSYSDGDIDGDGDVDNADIGFVAGAFTGALAGNLTGMSPAAVPEPATLFVMMAAGIPALLKRRRRRS
jgi:hypothetical protein